MNAEREPQQADGQPDQGLDGGLKGGAVSYREVLRPSVWLWLAGFGAAGFLAVAYGAALGAIAGWLCFAVLVALGVWVVGRTAAVVSVDDQVLRAGRAQLPLRFVGRVRALDSQDAAIARGPGADADAYLLLRTSYSRRAVAVEVTDPRDPHPYWLISTKRPAELVSAIMGATPPSSRAAVGPETPSS
jgi:hypothetical protein